MSEPSSTGSRRQAGRPPSEQNRDTKEALLDAASQLFAGHGIEGVSLRRLADEAGVTPAMVHYYFGNKRGLYSAMLTRTFSRILERAQAASVGGGGLDQLLGILFATVAAEPWIPALVVREVLSDDGPLRDEFVRGYASHMAALVPAMVRTQIDEGAFRQDLDPTLSFMSLLGMSLMPFVARPVVERVLGIRYDQDFIDRFSEHTRRLFVEGARS